MDRTHLVKRCLKKEKESICFLFLMRCRFLSNRAIHFLWDSSVWNWWKSHIFSSARSVWPAGLLKPGETSESRWLRICDSSQPKRAPANQFLAKKKLEPTVPIQNNTLATEFRRDLHDSRRNHISTCISTWFLAHLFWSKWHPSIFYGSTKTSEIFLTTIFL